MNLPNKLTLLRVILVPFFLIAMLLPENVIPDVASRLIAVSLFILTAFTDYLDGMIARKYNLITNFGKFMDPLADKFMVISALLGATAKYDNLRPVLVWVTLIVIFRELAITSLRLVANNASGIVIAASWPGKVKTASQCVAIAAILAEPLIPLYIFRDLHVITWASIAVMTFFTIYSGVQYLAAYKSFLTME